MKTTQVPGLILERLESAFLAIWVASVFTTLGNMYYTTIYGIRLLFGKGIQFQRILAIIIVEYFAYTEYLTYYGFLTTVFMPVLLGMIQWFRKQSTPTGEE